MGNDIKPFQFPFEGSTYCWNVTFFCFKASSSYRKVVMRASLNRTAVRVGFQCYCSVTTNFISYQEKTVFYSLWSEAHFETLRVDCMKLKGKLILAWALQDRNLHAHFEQFYFYYSIPLMNYGISPGFVIWDFKLLSIRKEYYQRLLGTQRDWKERFASGTYS